MTPKQLAYKAGRMIGERKSMLADPPKIDQAEFVLETLSDFISDIANDIKPIAELTLTVTANTWLDLPSDFIALYRPSGSVIMTKDGQTYCGEFETRLIGFKTQIKFSQSGEYTIKYEQSPTTLSDLETDINMHPYLIDLGAIYLAWKYLIEEASEDTAGTIIELQNRYLAERGKRLADVKNPSGEPHKIRDVYWGLG